jgi:iron complex outermembrane receptor protein
MHINGSMLRSAVPAAVGAALAMSAAQVALAQGAGVVEEVTVTGSRIRQTDGMITPVPVTALSREELATFEPGGTVAEQLDVLPQFYRNQTAQRGSEGPSAGGGNVISGDGGGSYLNMRSLGTNRTLVLLDGQRMMPADKRGSVNVDTFPMALVRSVEVVTGGASAAYGADALGGVTNFIINREFEGLEIDLGTGRTAFGDGDRWNFSVAGGKRFGERLNVIGSIEARQIDQIWRNPEELDEDWHRGWGWVINPEWYPGAPAGIPQRLTLPWVASSRSSPMGIIRAKNGSADTDPLIPFAFNEHVFLEDGSGARPINKGDVYSDPLTPGSTFTLSGGTEAEIHNRAFDAGPQGAEVIGRSLFAALQYRLTDNLSVFAQILDSRTESNYVQMRGDYYLAGGQHANVFRDNAFLPEEIGLAMDAAGIESFQLHKAGSFLGNLDPGAFAENNSAFDTYSWSIGLDATLPGGWDLRATWQSGKSEKHTSVYDEIRMDRLFLGMDAVRHPDTGAIVCRVQLYNPTEEQLRESIAHLGLESTRGGPLLSPIGLDNTIRDCVPYNIMGAGNMTREAWEYVHTPVWGESWVKQDFAEVVASGEVADGWGAGPLSLAAGVTWREQSFGDGLYPEDIDALGPPQNAPEIGIQGISPRWFASQATLWQWGLLPNISGDYDVLEWFWELNVPVWRAERTAQRIDTSFAYRSSDYSRISRIESWKIGIDFQLFEDLRLRATQSRDAREATFAERFDASVCGLPVTDPEFNNALFQVVGICGGNPNLRPELADTTVVGLVYQPSQVEGLSISVDWWDVKIKDAVGTLGTQRIVDECYAGVTFLCDQIVRDPVTRTISTIYNNYLNVDQSRVTGIDFEVTYLTEPDFIASARETLALRVLGGYIAERSDTPLGGRSRDVAGSLSTPDLTAVAVARYSIGDFGIQLQQRYVDETIRNIDWVEGVDVDDNTVSSATYTDLRLSYNGTMASTAYRIALDVTNLLDRAPPIVANNSFTGGAQLSDTMFDTFGRRYMLSVNFSF